MGAVGTRAHLIFPRRILPGISWTPPLDGVEQRGTAEECTELASLLAKWRRVSGDDTQGAALQTHKEDVLHPELGNSTVQQNSRSGQQASVAPVASLIQRFEGRALHPELQLDFKEQEQVEQASDLEKPCTPPKRESPLRLAQRVSSTEDEAASEVSSSLDMAALEELSPSMQNADNRQVACTLEANGGIRILDQSMGWKEEERDVTSPGRLPAYWGRRPGFCISVDDTSADTSSDGSASPPSDNRSQPQDEHTQEGMVPAHAAGHSCTRQLKTYAQLLLEETAAMKNAVGPWQPRVEKSSKLMEFQDYSERLRHVYERMQPFRRDRPLEEAKLSRAALSPDAAAIAASQTASVLLAEREPTLGPCFNGGQVLAKTPQWAMVVQQPPVTLHMTAPSAHMSRSHVSASADHAPDAAEAAARRLVARAAVDALAQASQPNPASDAQQGAPDPKADGAQQAEQDLVQQVAPAMISPAAVLQAAGYLAYAGLEGSLDVSARVCSTALHRVPLVGPRMAEPLAPQVDAQSPSLPVRWLRSSIKLAYSTAGNVTGIRDGLMFLAKQPFS